MIDPVASEFRRVRRQIERVNRRVATADLPGKVIPGSQDMAARTLRLDLGRSADGRVIRSPPIKWPQQGAGTLKLHHKPKDGEQMRMRSPSGTVGTGSQAEHSTYDADNAPPSTDGEEAVLEFGGTARIAMRGDSLTLSIGGTAIQLSPAGVVQVGQSHMITGALAIAGDALTHNGANISSDHVHGGVVRGGAFTNGPS